MIMKFKKKSAGIEFVNVKKCKKLHTASKTYLTKFRQMTKAEKIVLFEINQYDSDINGSELKEENHFFYIKRIKVLWLSTETGLI